MCSSENSQHENLPLVLDNPSGSSVVPIPPTGNGSDNWVTPVAAVRTRQWLCGNFKEAEFDLKWDAIHCFQVSGWYVNTGSPSE